MERKIKKFALESLLDWHYWSVENGCTILTIHGNQFNQEQIDYFINELGRHERKTEESRFEYIARTVEEIKKEGGILFERASALIEFMRIYRIAISKFGFGKEVTPYQFLSWASSRRTFSVPQDLRLWLEEERAKLPAGRKAALEAENEQLKARITELETELAACREPLEEARREISDKEYEYFFEAYPVCKMICDLHLAGNSQAEIRAALIDKGYTNAQTGFLTQEDTLIRSDDAVKQSVKRSQKKLKV